MDSIKAIEFLRILVKELKPTAEYYQDNDLKKDIRKYESIAKFIERQEKEINLLRKKIKNMEEKHG